MSGELRYSNRNRSGSTLKAELFSLDGSMRWNGSAMAAVSSTPTTSPGWEAALITLTEVTYQGGSGSGKFVGDLPVSLANVVASYWFFILDSPTTFADGVDEVGEGVYHHNGASGEVTDLTLADQVGDIIGGGVAGPGAIPWTVTVTMEDSTPVGGVQAWVSTDEEGDDVVAGPLTTDNFGSVTFMLDAGTYYLHKQRAGINFTNPQTMVVS